MGVVFNKEPRPANYNKNEKRKIIMRKFNLFIVAFALFFLPLQSYAQADLGGLGGLAAFGVLSIVLFIFLVVLAILWFLLPFAVFGLKKRLDRSIQPQEAMFKHFTGEELSKKKIKEDSVLGITPKK